MLGEIIAFVPTTDPERAREFYAGTLGLELEDESPFALVFRVSGTMLRVTVVQDVERTRSRCSAGRYRTSWRRSAR